MTSARIRPLAEADLIEQTRHDRVEAGDDVGERFFNAAVDALKRVEHMPAIGSLRVGELADVPGLRSFRIAGFPFGWFYFERADHIDVVRLLSYAQDVPGLLAGIDED